MVVGGLAGAQKLKVQQEDHKLSCGVAGVCPQGVDSFVALLQHDNSLVVTVDTGAGACSVPSTQVGHCTTMHGHMWVKMCKSVVA